MKTNGRIQLYPFLRIAVFLIIGIVAGTALYNKISVTVWFIMLATEFSVYLLARHHCFVQSWTIFIIIMTLGSTRAATVRMAAEVDFPSDAVTFRGIITSRPVAKGKTVRCDMKVTSLKAKPFSIKASFFRDSISERLRIGDGIEAYSRIKQPENFIKSTFDYRRYLLLHGYSGTSFIYADCWRHHNANLSALTVFERTRLKAMVFREKLLEHYRKLGITGQEYAVISAMTLGDKSAVSATLADDYSVSGAAHVLALSGLHLGIIFTILTFIFSKLRMRMLSLALVSLAIWAYVFIVGMSPSVMRSAIMLTVFTFVNLINRNQQSLNTLALAAVVILAVSPLDLYDVSFQMSFCSVLAILLLFRPLRNLLPIRWLRIKAISWVWNMVCVSLSAQIGVAPLVALYFGRFSCYFLLTNFMVVPLATVILYGAVLLLLTTPLPMLQSVVATMLFRLTKLLDDGVSLISSCPGASIDGININAFQTACCYVFIAAVCVLISFAKRMFWYSHRPLDDLLIK